MKSRSRSETVPPSKPKISCTLRLSLRVHARLKHSAVSEEFSRAATFGMAQAIHFRPEKAWSWHRETPVTTETNSAPRAKCGRACASAASASFGFTARRTTRAFRRAEAESRVQRTPATVRALRRAHAESRRVGQPAAWRPRASAEARRPKPMKPMRKKGVELNLLRRLERRVERSRNISPSLHFRVPDVYGGGAVFKGYEAVGKRKVGRPRFELGSPAPQAGILPD